MDPYSTSYRPFLQPTHSPQPASEEAGKPMDGLFIVDGDQNITLINEEGARLLGVAVGELTLSAAESNVELQSISGVLIPLDEWPSALALRGTFVKNLECKAIRKDSGQVTALQISTLAVKVRSGLPSQCVVAFRDITERDRIDAARSLSAAMVEFSDDAIVCKDTNGAVTSWNNGATKIFGYTAEEMIGQSIQRLLPMDLMDEETNILERLKRGETVHNIESVRLRKDGQPIHVSLTVSPIRDARGEIVGAFRVARDITARKLFDRRLLQSQKLESIGQLAGGVAHDFNNLLAIVLGSLELQHKAIRCLVPAFDGAYFSEREKDALWDKFYTGAPQRQRRFVERYNIVKRA